MRLTSRAPCSTVSLKAKSMRMRFSRASGMNSRSLAMRGPGGGASKKLPGPPARGQNAKDGDGVGAAVPSAAPPPDGVLVRFGEIGIKSAPVRRRMVERLRANLLDQMERSEEHTSELQSHSFIS